MVKRSLKALLLGSISGFVLGLMFKWIETNMKIKIYTLLLNIDFIPLIGKRNWGEPMEFIFHILFSCLVCFTYVFIIEVKKVTQLKSYIYWAIVVTFPTVPLYFPLSSLAIKNVPASHDLHSFLFWGIGHIIYALVLGWLGSIILKNKKTAY